MKDLVKCKEWERRRRDKLNDAFNSLAELLPFYDPAKNMTKIDILRKSTQFVKELRLTNSRLLLETCQPQETSKKVHQLQDEVNKLILRVKQLTELLKQANITIPIGPSIKLLGKNKNKWKSKLIDQQDIENSNPIVATSDELLPLRSLPKKNTRTNKQSLNSSSCIIKQRKKKKLPKSTNTNEQEIQPQISSETNETDQSNPTETVTAAAYIQPSETNQISNENEIPIIVPPVDSQSSSKENSPQSESPKASSKQMKSPKKNITRKLNKKKATNTPSNSQLNHQPTPMLTPTSTTTVAFESSPYPKSTNILTPVNLTATLTPVNLSQAFSFSNLSLQPLRTTFILSNPITCSMIQQPTANPTGNNTVVQQQQPITQITTSPIKSLTTNILPKFIVPSGNFQKIPISCIRKPIPRKKYLPRGLSKQRKMKMLAANQQDSALIGSEPLKAGENNKEKAKTDDGAEERKISDSNEIEKDVSTCTNDTENSIKLLVSKPATIIPPRSPSPELIDISKDTESESENLETNKSSLSNIEKGNLGNDTRTVEETRIENIQESSITNENDNQVTLSVTSINDDPIDKISETEKLPPGQETTANSLISEDLIRISEAEKPSNETIEVPRESNINDDASSKVPADNPEILASTSEGNIITANNIEANRTQEEPEPLEVAVPVKPVESLDITSTINSNNNEKPSEMPLAESSRLITLQMPASTQVSSSGPSTSSSQVQVLNSQTQIGLTSSSCSTAAVLEQPQTSTTTNTTLQLHEVEDGSINSDDKISECIARSIDLIDEHPVCTDLIELSAADWSHSDRVSPTQMFLSMFPLLPSLGDMAGICSQSIHKTCPNTSSSSSGLHHNFSINSTSSNSMRPSSFFIDSMLPDEHSSSSPLISVAAANAHQIPPSIIHSNDSNNSLLENLTSLNTLEANPFSFSLSGQSRHYQQQQHFKPTSTASSTVSSTNNSSQNLSKRSKQQNTGTKPSKVPRLLNETAALAVESNQQRITNPCTTASLNALPPPPPASSTRFVQSFLNTTPPTFSGEFYNQYHPCTSNSQTQPQPQSRTIPTTVGSNSTSKCKEIPPKRTQQPQKFKSKTLQEPRSRNSATSSQISGNISEENITNQRNITTSLIGEPLNNQFVQTLQRGSRGSNRNCMPASPSVSSSSLRHFPVPPQSNTVNNQYPVISNDLQIINHVTRNNDNEIQHSSCTSSIQQQPGISIQQQQGNSSTQPSTILGPNDTLPRPYNLIPNRLFNSMNMFTQNCIPQRQHEFDNVNVNANANQSQRFDTNSSNNNNFMVNSNISSSSGHTSMNLQAGANTFSSHQPQFRGAPVSTSSASTTCLNTLQVPNQPNHRHLEHHHHHHPHLPFYLPESSRDRCSVNDLSQTTCHQTAGPLLTPPASNFVPSNNSITDVLINGLQQEPTRNSTTSFPHSPQICSSSSASSLSRQICSSNSRNLSHVPSQISPRYTGQQQQQHQPHKDAVVFNNNTCNNIVNASYYQNINPCPLQQQQQQQQQQSQDPGNSRISMTSTASNMIRSVNTNSTIIHLNQHKSSSTVNWMTDPPQQSQPTSNLGHSNYAGATIAAASKHTSSSKTNKKSRSAAGVGATNNNTNTTHNPFSVSTLVGTSNTANSSYCAEALIRKNPTNWVFSSSQSLPQQEPNILPIQNAANNSNNPFANLPTTTTNHQNNNSATAYFQSTSARPPSHYPISSSTSSSQTQFQYFDHSSPTTVPPAPCQTPTFLQQQIYHSNLASNTTTRELVSNVNDHHHQNHNNNNNNNNNCHQPGTTSSVSNFNLSTIFPEINDKRVNNSNKNSTLSFVTHNQNLTNSQQHLQNNNNNNSSNNSSNYYK